MGARESGEETSRVPAVDHGAADRPDKNCWGQLSQEHGGRVQRRTRHLQDVERKGDEQQPVARLRNRHRRPEATVGRVAAQRRRRTIPPLPRAVRGGRRAGHSASGCLNASKRKYATSPSSGASFRVRPMYGRTSRSISLTNCRELARRDPQRIAVVRLSGTPFRWLRVVTCERTTCELLITRERQLIDSPRRCGRRPRVFSFPGPELQTG